LHTQYSKSHKHMLGNTYILSRPSERSFGTRAHDLLSQTAGQEIKHFLLQRTQNFNNNTTKQQHNEQ